MPMREMLDGENVRRSETVADALAGFGTELGLLQPSGSEETPSDPTVEPDDIEIPDLPEDLVELLDGPDLDDETEPVELDEYQDSDELARELARTRKRNQWLEQRATAVDRKNWVKEAKQYFPRSNPDRIQATSKRSFLRAARDEHDAVTAQIQPELDRVAALEKAAKEKLAEADRAVEAAKWGRPVTGAGGPPPSTTADERLATARRRGSLRESVRALIDSNAV